MSGIAAIGLRLVGTTKYITTKNTTTYLRSMLHVRNGFSNVANSIPQAQKESSGYWKIIGAFTKKTLWYSSIPFSILVGYYVYHVKTNPRFFEDYDMLTAVDDETLKYSIVPSKIITSSVLFDDGIIEIKTEKDKMYLMNDNTRNLLVSEELDANIQEPFPRGKPIPIKIGRFNGSLDNGKLILKTEDGETTFTFHHTVSLEVKKTSTTLQNEIAAKKEKQPEIKLRKLGQFNFIYSGNKVILKTPTREKKWTDISDADKNYRVALFVELFPIIGNFSLSFENEVKIQADDSDEIYHFKHNVSIECDKKSDENLQNKNAVVKKLSDEEIDTIESFLLDEILIDKNKTCDVSIDSGNVVFRPQDGDKFAVRNRIDMELFEDGPQAYLMWEVELIRYQYLFKE